METENPNPDVEQNATNTEEPVVNPNELSLEEYMKHFPEKVSSFKELLVEKSVMPFSTYDKFLPKMIHDQRFSSLPHSQRKPLFEDLVRNYTAEFQKSKQAEKKTATEALKAILDEYEKSEGFIKKPSYVDFRKVFQNDKRFSECLRHFDVEKYFNAKLEKVQRDIRDAKAKNKFQFGEMIKEYLLKGKGRIDRHMRWKDVKKELKKDPRYELVSSSNDRERLFQEILVEMARSNKERDRSRSRSRERERRDDRRSNKEHEGVSSRVEKMKRLEDINKYEILLAEKIKTYNIDFRDGEDLLKKDSRYKDLDIDRKVREELFYKYVDERKQNALTAFKQILDEKKHEIEPSWHYDEASKLFANDKRFDLKSRDAKRYYEDFLEKLRDEIFKNFEKFVLETPLLNKDSPIEGEEFDLLSEKLDKDFRYQRMEYRKDKREMMIKSRIQFLRDEYEKKMEAQRKLDDVYLDIEY